MVAILTFIVVFGLIVLVHEFGHYFWAKHSGILVRQFSIGMGPKLVSYTKNHTLYTIRLLPLGGYVLMAGAEDDDEELKPGVMVGLKLNAANKVICIDNSQTDNDASLMPVQIVQADLQKDLFIEGYVAGDDRQLQRFEVDHDATLIDETNTAMQIAPIDVQFNSASLWNRFLTNAAGPFNNLVFGVLLYVVSAFMLGGAPINRPQLGAIAPNSPAAQAHLQPNDQILAINQHKIATWDQMARTITKYPGQEITLQIKTPHQKVKQVKLTPKKVTNGSQKVGQIGVMQARNAAVGPTLKYGLQSGFQTVGLIFQALKQMVTGGFNLNQLGGPVAIYSETSQVAAMGFKQVVVFIAWLSINLGIMNLLPIPALDGGKLLLNVIEALRQKPISQKTEIAVNLVGVAFLLVLMVAVTWNDITRFFIK